MSSSNTRDPHELESESSNSLPPDHHTSSLLATVANIGFVRHPTGHHSLPLNMMSNAGAFPTNPLENSFHLFGDALQSYAQRAALEVAVRTASASLDSHPAAFPVNRANLLGSVNLASLLERNEYDGHGNTLPAAINPRFLDALRRNLLLEEAIKNERAITANHIQKQWQHEQLRRQLDLRGAHPRRLSPGFAAADDSTRSHPDESIETKSTPLENENSHRIRYLLRIGTRIRRQGEPYEDVARIELTQGNHVVNELPVRRGPTETFPQKVHHMLHKVGEMGLSSIVSYLFHGRAFAIHDPDRFTKEIIPRYFKQTKFVSFCRQLRLYGFQRVRSGPDAGAYYHELFLRGRFELCHFISRVGAPKALAQEANSTVSKAKADDPDFYQMRMLLR